jgi:hypothetical protein
LTSKHAPALSPAAATSDVKVTSVVVLDAVTGVPMVAVKLVD